MLGGDCYYLLKVMSNIDVHFRNRTYLKATLKKCINLCRVNYMHNNQRDFWNTHRNERDRESFFEGNLKISLHLIEFSCGLPTVFGICLNYG